MEFLFITLIHGLCVCVFLNASKYHMSHKEL